MADVRIVISDDLLQMEAWERQPAGFPGKPHREKYGLQQAGDVSWLVAWMDDRPCGSVTITWPESSGEHTEQGRSLGCAEIGGLGVDEELRGQGIGRALMEAAEELARKRGVLLLGLEVTATNPNQDAARALYSKLAYEDAGFGEFISGYTYWDPDGDRTGRRNSTDTWSSGSENSGSEGNADIGLQGASQREWTLSTGC